MADIAAWHTRPTRKLQIGERSAFVFQPSSISPGSKSMKQVLTKSAILPINLTPCENDAGLKPQNRSSADHRRYNAHQHDHQAADDRRKPHHAERIVELHDCYL